MRLLILVLLAACAAPSSQPASEDEATVRGTVTAVDLSPMAYDGDGEITVATESGPVEVHVPARTTLCAADLDAFGALVAGTEVEVVGARGADGAVRPCERPEHRLTVLSGDAEARTWRGLYTSGFETSRFRPCDQPDARWWLVPNDAFADRMAELLDQHGGDGRGRWVAVEATVEGTLGDAGQWGHLGAYDRELTVTDVREVVFLTADLGATPTCR